MWSPTLGVHTIANINAHPLVGTFNDAGQFLSQNGLVAKLWTPVMHVGLGSSRNPSQAGQSVTFTANVSSIVGPPPDGEHVEFMDGAKLLGPGTLNNGVARLTTSVLKAGTHSVKAIYDGDMNYSLTKSAVLQQVVNP